VRTVLAYFTEATGAEINYSSSENYEQQIVIDTQAGSPPNIAILPQPGLIQDLASKGLLMPLDATRRAVWVKDNYGAGESWAALGTYKDKDGAEKFFGFPYKADLKSLVWYVPENFEEAGYEVPQDLGRHDEAAHDQIVADGGVPWCIGLGSGGATGWPATDWVEDIMLRTQAPDVYDKWTKNEIPFNDPSVVGAHADFRRHRHQRQICRRRQGRGRSDRLPRQPERALRHPAQVLPAPPGVLHLLLLPGGHEAR
jgi:alpha-glucoside transport system substrate-binding protein